MSLTIGELSLATGIPIATLRDWDRRHGLGPSRRTAGNHRRYSRADADLVVAVRDLVADGMRLRESVRKVKASPAPARRTVHTNRDGAAAELQRSRDVAAATRAAYVAKRDELVAEREALVARRQSLVRQHGETIAGLASMARPHTDTSP